MELVARCLTDRWWGLKKGAFYTIKTNKVRLCEKIWSKIMGEPTGNIRLRCDHMFQVAYYRSNEELLSEWLPMDQSHRRQQ